MDHLRISVEEHGSWKQRYEEKMVKQLGEFKETYVRGNLIMDSQTYKAVEDGDPGKFLDVLKKVCDEKKLPFDEIFGLESLGGDSLLHVAAKYGSDKIAEVVADHDHYLLEVRNIKGNIPLHDAAQSKKGGSKVIKVILSRYDHDALASTSAKTKEDLTRRKNRVGNTALHEAVACGYLDGVIELYYRDKAVAHELNNANKSPLYLAVHNYMRCQRKEIESAKAIVDCLLQCSLLENMPGPKWCGGRSPLHAAIEAVSDKRRDPSFVSVIVDKLRRCCKIFDSDGVTIEGDKRREQSFVSVIVDKLRRCCKIFDADGVTIEGARLEELVKRPEMICLQDEDGRSPLHYAALHGYSDGVRIILENYPEAILEFDKDGNLPIHLACQFGKIDVVKELIRKGYTYPGLFLNRSGQNILHAAVLGGIVKYILTNSKRIKINLNEKDRDGNTPLHVASKKMHPKVLLYLTRDKRINLQCQNGQGLRARDIVLQESSGKPITYSKFLSRAILCSANPLCSTWSKEDRPTLYDQDRMKDLVNILMLVAILIATVTFAAGFTVPGSVYGSDEPNSEQRGVAVLAKRGVFQIFIVCNTVAMYSSTVGSFLLLWAQLGDYNLARNSFKFAFHMVALALMTMSGAFMAAADLVVHNVFGLKTAIKAIGAIANLFILSAYILLVFSFESHRPCFRRASFDILFKIILWFAGRYEIPDQEIMPKTLDSQKGNMNKDKNK